MTSTLQSASLRNSNLTPDGQKVLKRLKTDKNIVILTADKGRATDVMDKTDYNGKMDSLVNIYIYIYIHPFSKRFSYREIYR